jgi:hypothetical protein
MVEVVQQWWWTEAMFLSNKSISYVAFYIGPIQTGFLMTFLKSYGGTGIVIPAKKHHRNKKRRNTEESCSNMQPSFLGFVGNTSNKIGEFSCIHIHKDSFGLFQIINSKANLEEAMPGHSSTVIPFASDLLTNMDWADPLDNISGALFPNFFIVYFCQDFPQGGISSNDIKVKFAKLGAGYDLWVSAAAEAIDKRNDILEVLGAASEQTNYFRTDFLKSHFSHLTTQPNPCLSHLDHTASSPSLIQTCTQLRRMSNVKFPGFDLSLTCHSALNFEHSNSPATKQR